MDTWLIVLIVVVAVLAVLLAAWLLSRRAAVGRRKKEVQAREHLNEARERQARADSARAAADEQAARLRRERAELEQRMAQQEREAAQLAQDADREQARATELQERARKLAPHVVDEPVQVYRADSDGDGRPDGSLRERLDRDSSHRTFDRDDAGVQYTPVGDGAVRDGHAGTYRADSDGDGRPDGSLRERLDGDRDRDGDGYADDADRRSGLQKVKDRLAGHDDRDPVDRRVDDRLDERGATSADADDPTDGRHRR